MGYVPSIEAQLEHALGTIDNLRKRATALEEALRWALDQGSERMGLFLSGGTLSFEPEDHWRCFGCNGSLTIRARRYEQPPKAFPHDEGCKYMNAVRLLDYWE